MKLDTTYSIGQTVPVLIEGGVYNCVLDAVYTVNTTERSVVTYHGTATRITQIGDKTKELTREWGGTDEDIQKARDFKPFYGKSKQEATNE